MSAQLATKELIPISGTTTMHLVTDKSFSPIRDLKAMLAIYATDNMMVRVEGISTLKLVVAVPWWAVPKWVSTHHPEEVGERRVGALSAYEG